MATAERRRDEIFEARACTGKLWESRRFCSPRSSARRRCPKHPKARPQWRSLQAIHLSTIHRHIRLTPRNPAPRQCLAARHQRQVSENLVFHPSRRDSDDKLICDHHSRQSIFRTVFGQASERFQPGALHSVTGCYGHLYQSIPDAAVYQRGFQLSDKHKKALQRLEKQRQGEMQTSLGCGEVVKNAS